MYFRKETCIVLSIYVIDINVCYKILVDNLVIGPTMKELDRYVVPLIGTKWYHIGLVLLDAKHALDQLEKQYKHYTQHYCQLLFSTWLCISDNAT